MKEGNPTPCFYGLPKIHKQYLTVSLLRPICSGYNACTVRISEFDDHYLKPIVQRSSSSVKGTTDFILKFRQNNSSHLLQNDPFLVTMDAESRPKSQFIKMRRICSKLSDYKQHANVFVHYFAARGFNRRQLESLANSVLQINRDDLVSKGGFPLFAETTRSESASTR